MFLCLTISLYVVCLGFWSRKKMRKLRDNSLKLIFRADFIYNVYFYIFSINFMLYYFKLYIKSIKNKIFKNNEKFVYN